MRTILRAFLLGLGLSISYSTVFCQQVAKSISYPSSPDGVIGFLQFTPKDYGSQKHPLIIFLHGIGERGNGTSEINSVAANAIPKFCAAGASMRFTVNGQTSSFVVLSPQLSKQYGYWPTFYITEMIKYAKANLQIDPNRIYITGLSLGGGGIWRMITDASTYIAATNSYDYGFDGTIAAAAPVCGTQEETDANMCTTIAANHLPVWAFHCMDDGTVGVGATQHAEILMNRCAGTPAGKFTYYQSGGHGGAWINAYDTGHITTIVSGGGSFTANPNLYEWFLSNARGSSSAQQQQQIINTAPIANAGSAQTITTPLNWVNLAGSGTGTNGATISSYSWVKASGPSCVISNPTAATTSVTGLTAGTYVFTLTVTDNNGLTNSASVTVTVNTSTYTAPIANAGNAQTITAPLDWVNLAGIGTGTNGATISSYSWVKTSGASCVISNANAATATVSGLTSGTYVFTLTVTDNHGLTNSASVTVTVNASAYTAPIANAGTSQTITAPLNWVNLSGISSTGTNGSTIISYSWAKASGPTCTFGNAGAAITTVSDLVPGTYVFTLTVTDNHGLTNSASVTVGVNGSSNIAPVANAGSAIAITLPVSYTVLNATASTDADGSIVSYAWTKTSGPDSYIIVNPKGGITALQGLVQGTYLFTVTVTDDGGATASSQVTVTVNSLLDAATALPVPPVTTTTLLGYVKLVVGGPYQACGDASVTDRIPVYGTGIANGNILYTDAALTQKYNGGWNWYSFTPTLGSAASQSFSIYPDGSIAQILLCSGSSSQSTQQTASSTNLLGYIKSTTGGYYQACSDPSTSGRIAVYGKSIANGSILYTDAAMAQPFNGNWSWFSFTPSLGGTVTQAFAVYSGGDIELLRACVSGARVAESIISTSVEEDEAMLRSVKDSAVALTTIAKTKLVIYPNPVVSSATVELYAAEAGVKTVSVYDSKGVLIAKYNWQTIQGKNTFSLKNVSGLERGLYIIDIKESNGKPGGKLKFIKM